MPDREAQFRGEMAEIPVLGWRLWQRNPRVLLGAFVSVSEGMRAVCDCVPLYNWSTLITAEALDHARQQTGFWTTSDKLAAAAMKRAKRRAP